MLITSIFKYICGHANKLKYRYEMNEKQKKVTLSCLDYKST